MMRELISTSRATSETAHVIAHDRALATKPPTTPAQSGVGERCSSSLEPSPLMNALRLLLVAVERLRRVACANPRESVAIPDASLDLLRAELTLLERRHEDCRASAASTIGLAFEQIGAIAATVNQLIRQRFRVPNWTAKAAMVWIRLHALAVILTSIAPDVGERLADALTAHPSRWPRLKGITGVRLVAIPIDLVDFRALPHSTASLFRGPTTIK